MDGPRRLTTRASRSVAAFAIVAAGMVAGGGELRPAVGMGQESGGGIVRGALAEEREGGVQAMKVPGIRERAEGAAGGRAIIEAMGAMTGEERERMIVREALAGNVPGFLRTMKRVKVARGGVEGFVEVMPDYLALGGDEDWVRMPMTPMSARTIAEAWGMELATKSVVDAVWAAAEVKLEPRPLVKEREAPRTFLEHHEIIEAQRKGKPLGLLVSGIKKDVVRSAREREKAGRVVIYGWHRLDGTTIQPLTNVHRDTYVDYSHGVRLVRIGDDRLREALKDE